VRTCDWGDGVQCPNDRNPILFNCASLLSNHKRPFKASVVAGRRGQPTRYRAGPNLPTSTVVLGQGLVTVLVGLALGEVVAIAATGAVGSVQEGIRPPSLATHAVTALLWVGAAVLACYKPAARAASIDPLVALRHD
jgi:hypothetical protein